MPLQHSRWIPRRGADARYRPPRFAQGVRAAILPGHDHRAHHLAYLCQRHAALSALLCRPFRLCHQLCRGRWTDPQGGGAEILIHQVAKSLKLGSAALKLSFSVPDVDRFVATAAAAGLDFGTIHRARGYAFANTKDPDGNSISVSSRQYRA